MANTNTAKSKEYVPKIHKRLINMIYSLCSQITEPALSYIDRHERRPTLYTLKMIAKELNQKLTNILREVEMGKETKQLLTKKI